MASPPAKRVRRSIRQLSNDDDAEYEEPPKPTQAKQKRRSTLKRPSRAKNLAGGPAASVESPKRKTSVKSATASPSSAKKEPDQSKSLHNFFGKATEEQRWNRKTHSLGEEIEDGDLEDYIVDDDILDDDLIDLADLVDQKSSTKTILDRRKLFAPVSNGITSSQRDTPPLSQRFAKPPVAHRQSNQTSRAPVLEDTHRPWSDRYGPLSIDELAVHKKKVADVQTWLNDVLRGQDDRRLLVLKGPAGSGKSTTLSLLSQTLGVPTIHWNNPTAAEAGSTASVAAQFSDFLNRSGQYGSLEFDGAVKTENAPGKRVLVVEEFPTNMTRSSSATDSFRSVVLQYIATSAPALPGSFKRSTLDTHPPLIMIITETLLTSNTAATDSFTAHRLLGPEISNHPLVTIIEFNPVAPTFVTKALDLVIKKEARDSKRRRAPGPAVVQRLADMGDIRSAVNSLEFLCVRGDDNGDWSGTVAAKAKKPSRDGASLTNMEKQSLELISQRETTLDMFHAVGKVVYNKREDPRIRDPKAEPPPKPPDHLQHLNKPKISQVDIEALLNETGTDIQTFLSTLHENYILSCNGNHFVDAFTSCSSLLSDSDILNPDSRALTRSGRYGVGTGITSLTTITTQSGSGSIDTLRQDEISFQVAVRGLLFSLPFPVNRAAHPTGRKQDSFKMFYPASLRLWKPTEEVESLISLFMAEAAAAAAAVAVGGDAQRAQRGRNAMAPASVEGGGVASWRQRSYGSFLAHAENTSTAAADAIEGNDSDISSPTATLLPSRAALTLTQLPYMAKINPPGTINRTLTRITQFHGLNVDIPAAGEEPFDGDGDEEPGDPQPAVSRRVVPSMLARLGPQQQQQQQQGRGSGWGKMMMPPPPPPLPPLIKVEEEAEGLEKLYLTDDDIVDD